MKEETIKEILKFFEAKAKEYNTQSHELLIEKERHTDNKLRLVCYREDWQVLETIKTEEI